MKTILPALCGALLLASSLPAAAHQAKAFSGKQAAAGQAERSGMTGLVTNGSTRQLLDRDSAIKGSRVLGIQSTAPARPDAGRSFVEPGNGIERAASTSQFIDWKAKRSAIGADPHLKR